MKVYIVMGTTGEYSDRSEWPVCGYQDKALATQHADQATLWIVRMRGPNGRMKDVDWEKDLSLRGKSPWDKNIQIDYTGTDYYVIEVEMRNELPIEEV
jgi:hypothetical protein